MVPKTELRYDYEYAKRVYQGNKDFEDVWQNIINQGGAFEELYEKLINRILKIIPQYTGFCWEEYADRFIPIYFADSFPSLPHPLTLSINENPGIMLVDLIHELVHCNMYCGFKTKQLQEGYINLVTRSVIQKLSLNLNDEIEEFEKASELETKIIPEKINLDINKNTIKQYLNRPRSRGGD